MVKITISADCGNSPRKLFLKDFNVALAEGNAGLIQENVADDVTWAFVGGKIWLGKAEVLKQVVNKRAAELTLFNIITHGKEAAANGEKTAFCDVYSFQKATGNTIKSIMSYVIAVERV